MHFGQGSCHEIYRERISFKKNLNYVIHLCVQGFWLNDICNEKKYLFIFILHIIAIFLFQFSLICAAWTSHTGRNPQKYATILCAYMHICASSYRYSPHVSCLVPAALPCSPACHLKLSLSMRFHRNWKPKPRRVTTLGLHMQLMRENWVNEGAARIP